MECRSCKKKVRVNAKKHDERWGLCSLCLKDYKNMGSDAKRIKV